MTTAVAQFLLTVVDQLTLTPANPQFEELARLIVQAKAELRAELAAEHG